MSDPAAAVAVSARYDGLNSHVLWILPATHFCLKILPENSR